jgi:high-affinity Fe2+/Pb2+ permease
MILLIAALTTGTPAPHSPEPAAAWMAAALASLTGAAAYTRLRSNDRPA